MISRAWLPALLEQATFNGDWALFEEHAYGVFVRDFINSKPTYAGCPVTIKWYPVRRAREASYYHCTTEGNNEETRTPDDERIKRVGWIRAFIENCSDLSVWEERFGGNTKAFLWCQQTQFLVILKRSGGKWVLWTAYCTDRPHTQRSLATRFAASI